MQKNIASQKSQSRKSKKARLHNDQKKKARLHNDQKKKVRLHNDQKKKDKQRSKQTLHRNLKIEQHEPN